MGNLMLVEDDQPLGATLKERLEKEGHVVTWAISIDEAQKAIANNIFDLLILDIGLPDGSGLDFATSIRAVSPVPFLFLTAMNSAEYRLEGYELGAEDFIPKPFHLKELLLRVNKVLGRKGINNKIITSHITIDLEQLSITFSDGRCEFPQTKDFKVLTLLIESSPAVVSREEILQQIWKNDSLSTARTVDNSIVRLRQLLRRGEADLIRSVRGVGYQWVTKS
jgi:two-component system phosphate regulon response regulator PhoB